MQQNIFLSIVFELKIFCDVSVSVAIPTAYHNLIRRNYFIFFFANYVAQQCVPKSNLAPQVSINNATNAENPD